MSGTRPNPTTCQAGICLHRMLTGDGRQFRMGLLLVAIVLLSLGDLVLTLGHMTTTGMFEANPLASTLATYTGSMLSIANFKGLSVLIGVGLLYRLRRHGSAELAAWLVTAILVALSIQWLLYTSEISAIGPVAMADLAGHDATWVVLE